MTKLELNGVRKQYGAKTIKEAQQNMNVSCEMCVFRGWHKDCKFCPIAQANDIVTRNFEMEQRNRMIEEKLIQTNKRLLGLA